MVGVGLVVECSVLQLCNLVCHTQDLFNGVLLSISVIV